MTGITTTLGVGSGIDITGTVSQLTAAEGKPQLDAIATQTTNAQTTLSGLGTLQGALSSFQSAVHVLNQNTTFQAQQITSSDTKTLNVTADPTATAASHTVKITALATVQKSVSTSEFKSTDVVSPGTLVFNDNKGAAKFSVVITAGTNDSLVNVRDAINNAKGNNSVVASIMNVDSTTSPGTTVSKLVLTSKTPGVANSFSIDASQGDSRFNLNSTTPTNFGTTNATDAHILIDPQATPATPQSSIANVEFGNSDVVAPGSLSFKNAQGAVNFSVNIVAGTNDTPYEVMSAVNNAPNNNSVVASVINVASQTNPGTTVSKLVFTAKQPGVANQFSIDASQGDNRLSLGTSPANAQQSVSNTVFSDTDKVAPGTLTFKDATGTAKFSVTITPDTTTTVDSNGNAIPVDANGNPVIPNDANGNPVPTTTQTVSGNNTLAQLRDAINYNPQNKLVVASIASTTVAATTVDSGQVDSSGNPIMTPVPAQTTSKLVLTALNSGTDKGFSVDGSAGDTRFTLDPVNAPANFATTTTVGDYNTTNATDSGDGGQSVTQSSNSISNALPGVTLNLVAVGSADINVQLNQSAIVQPVSNFVSAYNTLISSLNQLTSYVGPGSSSNGPLLGDSTIQTVTSQIKNIINSQVPSATGGYSSLNQLGITFDKTGVMSVDTTILQTALSTNLTSVGDVFSSTNGVAAQLDSKITGYLGAKGPISTEQASLNQTLASLKTQQADVQTRLSATQATLLSQFTAMDSTVAQFKNTGTYLTQAFAPKTA